MNTPCQEESTIKEDKAKGAKWIGLWARVYAAIPICCKVKPTLQTVWESGSRNDGPRCPDNKKDFGRGLGYILTEFSSVYL